MAWGQNPVDDAAAQRAAAEAHAAIANRPLAPAERQVINALERIGDALAGRPPLQTLEAAGDVGTLTGIKVGEWGEVVGAGADALENLFPVLRDDFTRAGFERFAEAVLGAALNCALHLAATRDDETALAGGDYPTPPASVPTE